MVDKVGLPLMIVDREGQIVFGNRGLEVITGYRRDAILGLNIRLLCARYESDRYLFSTLSQIKKTTEVDIDFKKKDGRLFVASVSFSPFNHEGSHYLLLTVRDVTKERVQEGRTREEKEQEFRQQMEAAGFVFSGTSPDGRLVEIIELKDHPWFLASQFHPEFISRPTRPQPLFRDFVGASLQASESK